MMSKKERLRASILQCLQANGSSNASAFSDTQLEQCADTVTSEVERSRCRLSRVVMGTNPALAAAGCFQAVTNASSAVASQCPGTIASRRVPLCVCGMYGGNLAADINNGITAGVAGTQAVVVDAANIMAASFAAHTQAVQGLFGTNSKEEEASSTGADARASSATGDLVVDLPRLLEGAGEGDGLGAAALATEAAGRLERAANRAAGQLLQRLEPGGDVVAGEPVPGQESRRTAALVHARSVHHPGSRPSSAASEAGSVVGAVDAPMTDSGNLQRLGHVVAAKISDAAATLEQWAGFAGSAVTDWLGVNRYPAV